MGTPRIRSTKLEDISLQSARTGGIPLGAAMIMVGVISIMSAALPVDPSKIPAGTMALGALAVGALVTI